MNGADREKSKEKFLKTRNFHTFSDFVESR